MRRSSLLLSICLVFALAAPVSAAGTFRLETVDFSLTVPGLSDEEITVETGTGTVSFYHTASRENGGLIGTLLGRMGVDCDALLAELDTEIRKLPRISGGSGEVYASPEVGKILNLAEKTAEKLHDEYLSVEHLMLAIFSEGSQSVRQLLSDHGITRSRFSDELAKVKTSPVTSDNPEDS